ncbi:MAG: hydrogenase maturation nickel metallochaperone HypA [Anaerolineales bacterium]
MHELSVTQALLDLALDHAKKAHAVQVTDIYLEIGQLSSYVDDSVQFYWDLISAGTLAEKARLHFHRTGLEMTCQACGNEFAPNEVTFACPQCGSEKVRVSAGEEFRLTAIDVERGPVPKVKVSQ